MVFSSPSPTSPSHPFASCFNNNERLHLLSSMEYYLTTVHVTGSVHGKTFVASPFNSCFTLFSRPSLSFCAVPLSHPRCFLFRSKVSPDPKGSSRQGP